MPIPLRIASLLAALALTGGGRTARAQSAENATSGLTDGKAIFQAGCAGCHGPDGKGAPQSTIGFDRPATFPDFTACDQTTPELDVDWMATIHDGGRGRGFSRIMPSFSAALTRRQLEAVIRYLRGFCREPAWPRGELNLPRPLTTEKAFPEDETVITTAVDAKHAPDVGNELVYEHRYGIRDQLEVSVPFSSLHDASSSVVSGVGDVGFGLKHVLFSSHDSILSAQGELILPTGNKDKGLGSGVTVIEAFASYGRILPSESFIQLQGGTEQPTSTEDAPRAAFGRAAVGRSFRQEDGLGRMWTPMIELLADRDFETGARTDFDLLPQFQVTLSRRQHVRANIGWRLPINDTAGRPKQIVFYLLWDWFDGGLLEGWK